MSRDRRDESDDPFGATFRLMEQMMEQTARNLDLLLGPFGTVESSFQRTGAPSDGVPTDSATIEVYEMDEEVQVVADVHGVQAEDLHVTCDGDTLSIRAASEYRQYDETIRLPVSVEPDSATGTIKNGVLAVTLAPSERNDDSPVTVE